jgi:hypothetical protein
MLLLTLLQFHVVEGGFGCEKVSSCCRVDDAAVVDVDDLNDVVFHLVEDVVWHMPAKNCVLFRRQVLSFWSHLMVVILIQNFRKIKT